MPASLTRRLAELEGAESALVLASGRAAVACTALALLRPGDHLLAGTQVRASTREFFDRELPALGVEVSYVDPRETRGWRRGLRRTTRALYLESPVLETGRLLDLRPPRTLAQELGIALIVDATGASPVAFRPITHGVDIVLHDATYFFEPQGDGEAGIVAGTEGLVEEVRLKMATWGAVPHPLACQQLERGLATLELRVRRQNETAQAVAEWAVHQPAIAAVSYPGLADHPDRAFLTEWFAGAGALIELQLAAGADATAVASQVGVALRADRTERQVSTRVHSDAAPGRLRLQVGLEPAEVIVGALQHAFATTAPSSL